MSLENGATTNPNQDDQHLATELGDNVEAAHAVPVTGNWFKPFRGNQVLELGIVDSESVGGIRGAMTVEGPHKGQVKIERVEIFSTEDRGKGLGKRLLKTFAAEAKQAGATTLVGDIISAEEIHNRVKTFGEENVTFYETLPAADDQNGREVELPLTRQQAIDSLNRAQHAYGERHVGTEDPDEEEPTISARTDLTMVDTSEWELPVIGDVTRRPKLSERIDLVAHAAGSVVLEGSQNS